MPCFQRTFNVQRRAITGLARQITCHDGLSTGLARMLTVFIRIYPTLWDTRPTPVIKLTDCIRTSAWHFPRVGRQSAGLRSSFSRAPVELQPSFSRASAELQPSSSRASAHFLPEFNRTPLRHYPPVLPPTSPCCRYYTTAQMCGSPPNAIFPIAFFRENAPKRLENLRRNYAL